MLITSYAQIEELIENGKLTAAEKALLDGCQNGQPVFVGDGQLPNERTDQNAVRAGLLRYLMCGGCDAFRPHDRGVELVGAWIEGELDLAFATTKGGILLAACSFQQKINALQMVGDALNLTRSRFPGLFAQGAKIAGNVYLNYATSEGKVSFAGAEIDGQLSCQKAKLNGGDGEALNAHSAKIAGGVYLDDATSEGKVSFSGAEIGGQLSCNRAKLKGGTGDALNAQSAKIADGVFLDDATSEGEVSFAGAEIGGQLSCNRAKLKGGTGEALNAHSAKIAGGVFLDDATSEGEVSFLGAEIGGQFACNNAKLNGGNGMALNAQRLVVKESFFWREVTSVSGMIDLTSAHVGDLADDKESWDKVEVLTLSGFTYDTLHGSTNLTVRKIWLKRGAKQNGEFHPQPYQQLAKVLRANGHRAEARDILVEKEIERRRAERDEPIERNRRKRQKLVQEVTSADFSFSEKQQSHHRKLIANDTKHRFWSDSQKIWDRLSWAIAAYGYKPWLSLYWLVGLIAIVSGLACFTWQAGDFAPNSDVILTSKEWKSYADALEADGTPTYPNPAEVWSRTPSQGAIGHGRDYETYNSLFYAMDVVVPIINLGQTEAWAPSTSRGQMGIWMFYLQKVFVILGWVITAIAAAAITGIIRNNDEV